MKNSREYLELKKTLGVGFKSSQQKNELFEADCEILKLGSNKYLATSIDSLSEEIDLGLYREVETWAWIAAMSSVSDLAASGTKAIGLTLSAQWKYGTTDELKQKFYKAFNQACKKANVHFLGGDSGNGSGHTFTTSIIGESTKHPLMRTNVEAGDYLVLAHGKKTGLAPALAFRYLLHAPAEVLPEKLMRPEPSWKFAHQCAPLCRAAIDTSDGIATSIYILGELNKLGANLFWNPKLNSPIAATALESIGLSPYFLWLGDHGDFQTMFVVPEKNIKKFPLSPKVSIIGQMTKKKNYRLVDGIQTINLPIEKIVKCPRDLDSYVKLVNEMQNYLSTYKK